MHGCERGAEARWWRPRRGVSACLTSSARRGTLGATRRRVVKRSEEADGDGEVDGGGICNGVAAAVEGLVPLA